MIGTDMPEGRIKHENRSTSRRQRKDMLCFVCECKGVCKYKRNKRKQMADDLKLFFFGN